MDEMENHIPFRAIKLTIFWKNHLRSAYDIITIIKMMIVGFDRHFFFSSTERGKITCDDRFFGSDSIFPVVVFCCCCW